VKETFDFNTYHNEMKEKMIAQDLMFAQDVIEKKLEKSKSSRKHKSSLIDNDDEIDS